jgi:hypothetical protein
MDLTMMERVGNRWEKMEGSCSTGQSPQRAAVPVEEEEEEEEWTHNCPKHVEKSNKHIKKNCAPSWFFLQDFTRMHRQQNIKFQIPVCPENPLS